METDSIRPLDIIIWLITCTQLMTNLLSWNITPQVINILRVAWTASSPILYPLFPFWNGHRLTNISRTYCHIFMLVIGFNLPFINELPSIQTNLNIALSLAYKNDINKLVSNANHGISTNANALGLSHQMA